MFFYWRIFAKNQLERMRFRPIQMIFHAKNGPNLPNFEKKEIQITRFLQ
jgi:hypothetical protein